MANYRNEEQHARKVDHIAMFCAGVLAAEGPAALEPNTIGRRIDGSGYNVSNLFPNRAALVALVLDRHVDGLLAAVGRPGDWPGTPDDRLVGMATAYLERVELTRGVHAVVPDCRRFLPPAKQTTQRNCRRWMVDGFEAALEECVPATARSTRMRRMMAESLLFLLDGWVSWSEELRTGPHEYAELAVGMVAGAEDD